MDSLVQMFAPKSIAVIGASQRDGSLGKMFMDAVDHLKYLGKIYPVNPKSDVINDLRCYKDIQSLPETPDLAIILISKDFVIPTIDLLAEKNVKNIIVISAGFREVGLEGKKLEETLIEKTRQHGMRMIGPNSMGLFNTDPNVSLNATFSPTPPKPGHVCFISQSGALGVAVLELSQKLDLGFSLFVSTGNKADIGDVDVLHFAANDPNTKTIILYQESIDHPDAFRLAINGIVSQKPVLVLKAGRTESGGRAASSHTGALAANERITDAYLKQCGVIRCHTLQELLYSAHVFSTQPIPHGNRVAVITNAGGPGILASDALESAGLCLPEISEETCLELNSILPAEAGLKNPIDMIASATHDTYHDVCCILEHDNTFDALFVIIVKPPVATSPRQIIQKLVPLIKKSSKPFFFTVMADVDDEYGMEIFNSEGIPVFPYPELAAETLGNMVKYNHILNNYKTIEPELSSVVSRKSGKKRQQSFTNIANILKEYGLPLAPYMITDDRKVAQVFLEKEKKVVVKIANEEIIHKSDLGMVKLDITSIGQLNEALDDIAQNAQKQIGKDEKIHFLVQKMVPTGIEMILGASDDPVFGPVIMFGIGGVFVELYQDIVFRVLPVSQADTLTMIAEITASKLLDGFRGLPAIDTNKLAELIYNFGKMIQNNHQIIEMDINPLIWPMGYDQPVVVDCRMTISE